jgi:PEP-CTERM motif
MECFIFATSPNNHWLFLGGDPYHPRVPDAECVARFHLVFLVGKGKSLAMMQLKIQIRTLFLLAAVLMLAGSSARADIALLTYEFQTLSGSETSVPVNSVISGLSATSFTESSVLKTSAGANSINSSGWNLAGANYSFGLTANGAGTLTVDSILMTSKSSATGPGFISLQASVDGGTFTTVGSIIQTNTLFNDELLVLNAPVTASHSIMFQFVVANQTSAGSGTGTPGPIGSAGTFRVGDNNPAGTATPFTVNGTFIPSAAVPEPASIAMAGLGGLCVAAFAARRRKAPWAQ